MNQQQQSRHTPVLLEEVLENLQVQPDGIYVDATFGRGGHSRAILQRLSSSGKLLVMDKDPAAIAEASALAAQDARVTVRHGSFIKMNGWLQELDWTGKVSGILLDVGVSSPQLDEAARGFSFIKDGALDMRMDPSQQKMTAAKWINTAPVEELAHVFATYGEERFSKRIAQAIVKERAAQQPILTTGALSAIVSRANPRWEKTKHPATRVFQAVRIFINDELNELRQALEQSVHALKANGRLLVITFHSLEDRCVKNFIQEQTRGTIPNEVPIKHEQLQLRFKRVGRVIRASINEVKLNPRARSAALRVLEKIL